MGGRASTATHNSRWSMEDLRESFQQLRAKALALVKEESTSFAEAPLELRGCKDIALTAIEQTGGMFKFASPELQADREVVALALEINISMMSYVSPELKANRGFIMELIPRLDVTKVDGLVKHMDKELRKDAEVMRTATMYWPKALAFAHGSLKSNKDFVISAIGSSSSPPVTFSCVPAKLQRDAAVAQAAKNAFRAILESLPNMPDFDTLMRDGSIHLDGQCAQLLRATFFSPERLQRRIVRYNKLHSEEAGGYRLVQKTMKQERESYNDSVAGLKRWRMEALPSGMQENTMSRSCSRSPRRELK